MKYRVTLYRLATRLRRLLGGAALLASVGVAYPAAAATFNVNSTLDAVDATPGDGICLTAAGDCTLRAAITEANAAPGSTINLPAGTYHITIPANVLFPDDNTNGDLDILASMTINGAGAASTIIDGDDEDRVLDLFGPITVSISNVTVRNGEAGQGAGIRNNNGTLTLTDVIISDNEGNSGGGIFANNGNLQLNRVIVRNNVGSNGAGIYCNLGQLTITNSTINGNSASNSGGGLYLKSTTSALVTNSTINGNTATISGGGVFNQGVMGLTNVTISGNTTGSGGGIYFQFPGTLMNVTIFNNSAAIAGGGIYSNVGGATLTNTIVAGSIAGGNCGGSAPTSNGYNLEDAKTCGFAAVGDQRNKPAQLNPLANNGGLTRTHALQVGSPAIDAGTTAGAPATDQRGVARVAPYDVGAFEGGTAVTPAPLQLVKQVYDNAGTCLASSPSDASCNGGATSITVAAGSILKFLLFVRNTSNLAASDLRFTDVLETSATGFMYTAGSIRRTAADASAPTDSATAAIIFTAANSGTAQTDVVGGPDDYASYVGSTLAVGAVTGQASQSLGFPAHKSFGIIFNVIKK